ncbi:MAG: hypothetical protein Q9209_003828 [Squamulea sp. 1 TL-2023]
MTRRDILKIFHEPFGDAFYYGPERISPASSRWPPGKIERSGKAHYTYDLVLEQILDGTKDTSTRVFLKDMSYHIIPPIHSTAAAPPSLQPFFTLPEPPNPTLFPTSIIQRFQFVFLIRNPSAAIPSLYRCFIPPLSAMTDEHFLDPTELGYREMRILLDCLYPPASHSAQINEPLLIDADDLLANPEGVISAVCSHLQIPYSPSMLSWPSAEDYAFAKSLFDKFAGYHEDALNSTGLRPKSMEERDQNPKSREKLDEEWEERYGVDAARTIRAAVDLCQEDYEYLRQFRIQI